MPVTDETPLRNALCASRSPRDLLDLAECSVDATYRDLFPGLRTGTYCAHHAMGMPSSFLPRILAEHASLVVHHGIGAWPAGWDSLQDHFRMRVAELVGADLERGDVVRFENFSDGVSALLASLPRGRLLAGADHFTAGRYAHEHWAKAVDGLVVELQGDRDDWVPTSAYLDALTADTTIVSLSTCHWKTGRMHDVAALADAMRTVCPDAVLLIDVYQSLGTVPFDVEGLPRRTAVLGGGIKQLHAGTGSGFAWISNGLFEDVHPRRTGWFAHLDPFAFADPPRVLPPRGADWRTGVPDVTPMVALTSELDVLGALAEQSLQQAVAVVRKHTSAVLGTAVERAREAGFDVVGDEPMERRGAFFAVRVQDGDAKVEALAQQGFFIDHRPDGRGAGLIRMSTAMTGHADELARVIRALADA